MLATMILAAALIGGPGDMGPMPEVVNMFGMDVVPMIQGDAIPLTGALHGLRLHDPQCYGCDPWYMIDSTYAGGQDPYGERLESGATGWLIWVGEGVMLFSSTSTNAYPGWCMWIEEDEDCKQRSLIEGCTNQIKLSLSASTGWRVRESIASGSGAVVIGDGAAGTVTAFSGFIDCGYGDHMDYIVEKKLDSGIWVGDSSFTVTAWCDTCMRTYQ